MRLWDAATGAPIGPAMKHGGPVFGAVFSRSDGRILSWLDDKTLRLWDAAWRGGNLFEIACNHLPQTHDFARLSKRYGVQISDPICEAANKIPLPDWRKIERAPE